MSRKRLCCVMCVVALALFLGTTDAEARSRYGRRSNQQNGCRQSSNYGRSNYGSTRGNTRSRAQYYNTTGHGYSVSGHDPAGFGNYGHNNSGFQSYSHHNYSPGNH
ncbi:MAG: hypothetical protein U0936_25865 [Planctomycetaceae bacterium]|jgi:hypothetical protein